MNGFERRREQKKESIRQATLELFTAHGIGKVTVEEIATRASVSPVTIFKYFVSKQNLVRDVVKWALSNAYQHHESVLRSDQPYLSRIRQVMFEKSRWLDTAHRDLLKVVISRDPEIKGFAESMFQDKQKQLMSDFFEEGKQQGYIHPDLSIDSILIYMEGLRGIAYTHPEFFAQMEHNKHILRDFIRLLFFGLMGKEALPEELNNI